MQLITLIFLATLFHGQAYANLPDIIHSFLHKNSDLSSLRTKLKINNLNYQSKEATKSWLLLINAQKADSTLEDNFTYTSTLNDAKAVGLTLEKDFFWGGGLSLKNQFNTNKTTLLGQQSYFTQSLTYSQDLLSNLFGRIDKLELEIIDSVYFVEKESLNLDEESRVLNLINLYLNSFESKKLVNLYRRAYKRSIKREKLIRGRVKDGLNQKADLFSSTGVKLLKLEELENMKLKHEYDLAEISKLLHRQVTSNEITNYNFKYDLKNESSKNKNLKLLIQRTRLEKEKLKLIKHQALPSLVVSGTYETNDYDKLRSETLSNGNLTGDHSSTEIGVSLVWQLGAQSAEVNKSKSLILIENMKYQKSQLLENIKLSYEILEKQILVKKKNMSSGKKRLALSKKVLKEYAKLYKRSKADLDQIIRAEENLIETSKGLLHSQIEIKKLEFSYAALNGELLESILGRRK